MRGRHGRVGTRLWEPDLPPRQPERRPRRGPFWWLSRQLSRIRLAVWLLIIMTVTMIVGSVFPQGYDAAMYIQSWGKERYASTTVRERTVLCRAGEIAVSVGHRLAGPRRIARKAREYEEEVCRHRWRLLSPKRG